MSDTPKSATSAEIPATSNPVLPPVEATSSDSAVHAHAERGGRPARRKGGTKEAEVPAAADVEVVQRGRGRREAAVGGGAEAAVFESVVVTEDLDFEAMMGGDGQHVAPATPGFEPGTKVSAVVESIAPKGPEIFLDLGGKATGYVLKEDVRDAEGNIVVKVGDTIEGIVFGEDDNGIRIRTRLGQEANLDAVKAALAAGLHIEGKVAGHNKGGYEIQLGNIRAFCPHSQIDVIRVEDPATMIGKSLEFKIIEIRDGGGVVVSHARVQKEAQAEKGAALMATLAVGQRLSGRVRSIQKFGVFVDLGGKDGLVHVSELSWQRVEDPNEVVKVGDEVAVVVTDFNSETGKLGLSMKRAQEDPVEALGAKLQIGETVTGVVTRMKPFGAFIELGDGVEGLVHISDLAHYRVRKPEDILKTGETVRVKVLDIDLERRQIKLSLKALSVDPWDAVAERYPAGKEVTGTVESIQDFGAFVTLEPGVTALLPASESKTDGQPLHAVFKVGKTLTARILRVDLDDHKIALTRYDEDEVKARAERDGRRGPRRNTERMGELGVHARDGADWTPPGGRRKGTLAYSDDGESGKKGKADVGSLGALLMQALKKDK